MRVALVSDWYLPRLGGIELHLRDLARELAARGHEPHVVTTTPDDPRRQGGLQSDPLPVPPGVAVHRLDLPLVPGVGFTLAPRTGSVVAGTLAAIRPRVVHVHAGMVPPLALAAGRAAHEAGLPVVATFHSLLGPVVVPWRLSERALGWSRWAQVLSGVGPRVADEITRVVRGREVTVLPNGVDPEAWRSAPPAPGEAGTLRLIAVMRLQRRKRGLALLRAAAGAAAALEGHTRVVLTVVGHGPRRPALEREARRLGIADRVRWEGYVPRSGLPAKLAAADVFVSAAVQESFGLAALEARCAGLAVVARRDSGVGDRVADGTEGLLADDDAGLAAAIVRLARDRALLDRMKEHNRTTPTPHSWDAVVARHLEAYADALVAVPGGQGPEPRSGSAPATAAD